MKTFAEVRFEWLLSQRSICYWDEEHLQDKLVVAGTRPDYYVEATNAAFIAEVEGFTKRGPMLNRIGSLNPNDILKRIRTPVDHAARQLRPYKDAGLPMIIVLDNHKKVGIPLGVTELTQLFGTYEVVVDRTTRHSTWRHGGGRTIDQTRKHYISAIIVNEPQANYVYVEPVTQERPMKARVLYNPYATHGLPVDVFAHPEDEHIFFVDGRWTSYGPQKI